MRGRTGWIVAAWMTLGAGAGGAQELADFDYENLSFRGAGLEWGYMRPSRVEPTSSWALRMDLGYLGPGLRIVPSVGYWSSTFRADEVAELEQRVAALVQREAGVPPPDVDLGTVEWSDIRLGADAHVVWQIPWNLLSYAGLGVSAHLLNGDGEAIRGTFIEDLLDSVTAGVNIHAGLEYPVSPQVRVYGTGRYELQGDLQYGQLAGGLQFMLGGAGQADERTR